MASHLRGDIPMRSGDEADAFSRYARHVTHWQPGELKKIKRLYHKRVRADGRRVIRQETTVWRSNKT